MQLRELGFPQDATFQVWVERMGPAVRYLYEARPLIDMHDVWVACPTVDELIDWLENGDLVIEQPFPNTWIVSNRVYSVAADRLIDTLFEFACVVRGEK